MIFESGVKIINEEIGPAYWFLFYHDELLVSANKVADNKYSGINHIPFIDDINSLRSMMSDIQYLGLIDGKDSCTATLSGAIAPDGHIFVSLRKLFGGIEDDWYWLANRAYHLINWRKKNKFCGCCGEVLTESPDEVAMNCGKCGNIVYPRISPAVIVAITKGNQILLAHAARFTSRMYSVIAGFVEPGESLEECVKREVLEEVGLTVQNVRYFSSQPWPYPDSLMIAFTAEYGSGEIRIDEKEITDAGWYTRDNLPEIPSKASVARKLIDAWLQK